MAFAQKKASDGRFTAFRSIGDSVAFRNHDAPTDWDVIGVTARTLLDRVYDQFLASPHDAGPAMYQLQSGLSEVRSSCPADEWDRVASQCQTHPVGKLVWQDPFTHHSHSRPSGYAGDARLLDYLYGESGVPEGTTALGASVFRHMMAQQGALGVRARRDLLAQLIDETAAQVDRPRILSIACGHLREAAQSSALREGRVGELVALDQDVESLAQVERACAGMPVRTVNCSVRAILSGKTSFEGFHFVYAAGLYDYLSERVATRLTRLMFDMLAPGGRLLVANFAPVLPEVGYMETFMAWKLIYRSPDEMARLSADVPDSQWKSHRVFWDDSENVVFLDLVKRSSRTRGDAPALPAMAPEIAANSSVTVPGMNHVTFGPAVHAARATTPTGPMGPNSNGQ